jgi:polyphosphate kinase
LIDREILHAKAGSKNIKKMNSLSDFAMIDKLYEASNAGVKYNWRLN